MEFSLGKYGVIFTEFKGTCTCIYIYWGGASASTFTFIKYILPYSFEMENSFIQLYFKI